MEATVYSYKMTFQTLTFRDDPRFQDGLYILVVTELAENEVNRTLFGPLTEDVLEQFRVSYTQATEKMIQDAIRLLPRYYKLPAGLQKQPPAKKPGQTDEILTAGWEHNTPELAIWDVTGPISAFWERRSPDQTEVWYALQDPISHGWYWQAYLRGNLIAFEPEPKYASWREAAVALGKDYIARTRLTNQP